MAPRLKAPSGPLGEFNKTKNYNDLNLPKVSNEVLWSKVGREMVLQDFSVFGLKRLSLKHCKYIYDIKLHSLVSFD